MIAAMNALTQATKELTEVARDLVGVTLEILPDPDACPECGGGLYYGPVKRT